MAIKLIANYSKRLGLPGYSSHQFSVSVETELVTTDDIPGESERLYQLLQTNVDEQILTTGFVPPYDYGMDPPEETNGANLANGSNGSHNHAPNGSSNGSNDSNNGQANARGHAQSNGTNHAPNVTNWQRGPAWKCSDKQRELILKLVDEHQLDKADVEALAIERFGKGVRILNKIEASGLIDELLDTHGGNNPGQDNTRRRNGSAYNGAGRVNGANGTNGRRAA
ncbi:MAG: hypothetical protein WCK77_10965 [Verrucomicrobiota bacterium]